jgi:CrcB protein
VILLGVAVAGGLGAVARLVLDGLVRQRLTTYPAGTLLINLTGSLALGLLAGLGAAAVLPPSVQLVAGTGFLGGYTTFSAASVETVRLVRDRRVAAAVVHGLGMLVGSVGLAALGWWLGSLAAH